MVKKDYREDTLAQMHSLVKAIGHPLRIKYLQIVAITRKKAGHHSSEGLKFRMQYF